MNSIAIDTSTFQKIHHAGAQTLSQKKRRRRTRKNKSAPSGYFPRTACFPKLGSTRVSPIASTHVHPSTASDRRAPSFECAVPPSQKHERDNDTVVQDSSFLFTDPSKVVAIDCEMVGVGPGGKLSVLARVSVVDWHGTVLLDSFVKVRERITDYRTHVSGIRPSDMVGPKAIDFGTARRLVEQLLKGKLLVGHGLVNDLKVFRLTHPWHMIRDSATYQPLMRFNGQPRRLKELASAELGLVIQKDGCEHDSIDDARAAMAIFKRHQAGWDYDVRSMLQQRGSFRNY